MGKFNCILCAIAACVLATAAIGAEVHDADDITTEVSQPTLRQRVSDAVESVGKGMRKLAAARAATVKEAKELYEELDKKYREGNGQQNGHPRKGFSAKPLSVGVKCSDGTQAYAAFVHSVNMTFDGRSYGVPVLMHVADQKHKPVDYAVELDKKIASLQAEVNGIAGMARQKWGELNALPPEGYRSDDEEEEAKTLEREGKALNAEHGRLKKLLSPLLKERTPREQLFVKKPVLRYGKDLILPLDGEQVGITQTLPNPKAPYAVYDNARTQRSAKSNVYVYVKKDGDGKAIGLITYEVTSMSMIGGEEWLVRIAESDIKTPEKETKVTYCY